jgi:sec-independent protein translocase protein TatC
VPFGFIFELPLFIFVMARLGIIGSGFLVAKRKMVLFLSFVIGAFISPTPDVFSQTMVAVPMILLYEISILIVKYILRK